MDMPDRASFPNLCQQINTLRNAEAQEAQAGGAVWLVRPAL